MRESMIGLLGKRSGIHSFTRRHEGSPLATAIFGTHHSLSTRLTPFVISVHENVVCGGYLCQHNLSSWCNAMPPGQQRPAGEPGRTIFIGQCGLKGDQPHLYVKPVIRVVVCGECMPQR